MQCLSPRQRDLRVEFFCMFGTPSNRERKNPSNSEILFQFSILPWLTSPMRLPPSTPTYPFLLSTLHLPCLSHSLTKYRYLISSPSDIVFMQTRNVVTTLFTIILETHNGSYFQYSKPFLRDCYDPV